MAYINDNKILNVIFEGNVGVGKKTENGGEIFNDYKNNYALSLHSSASGSGTVAGIHAFKINSVSEDRKCYYLDSCEGLEKGDVFSAILGHNAYLDVGVIEAINTENNSVTIDYINTSDILSERTVWSNAAHCSFNMSAAYDGSAYNDRIVFNLGNVTMGDISGVWQLVFNRSTYGIDMQILYNNGTSAFYFGDVYRRWNYPDSGNANYKGSYGVTYTLTPNNLKLWMNGSLIIDFNYNEWIDTSGNTRHITLTSFESGYNNYSGSNSKNHLANVSNYQISQDSYEFYFAVAAKPHTGTVDFGKFANANGYQTLAPGYAGVTEGVRTKALHSGTHAGGLDSVSSASVGFTHGCRCVADAYAGVALGFETIVRGLRGMAVNSGTESIGDSSFAANLNTKSLGTGSFTSGGGTVAEANFSYAGGYGTIASAEAQTVIGKFNEPNPNALFIIGNGDSDTQRSNIFEVRKDGSLKLGAVEISSAQLIELLKLI